MPELAPFLGLRPQPLVTGPLAGVICPPYDVINEEERLQLVARSPYNAVRVELPNGDYQGAARLLAQWRRDGALQAEPEPALYGYRMSYEVPGGTRRHTTGVLGALSLEPPGHGILPHEQTTPKAKSDRLELIRATRTNTSPIWCLCGEPGLVGAIGPVPTSSTALAGAKDDEGTLHEIWPIYDPGVIEAVARVVRSAPLLVADGHHRYETALVYRGEKGGPGADAILALVVELSEEQLSVLAIHRTVSGLPQGFDLVAALDPHFRLLAARTRGPGLLDEMVATGGVGVITAAGTWVAVPRPAGLAEPYDLDSSRTDAVLATLPEHEVIYEHDPARAENEVRSGRAQAALLCRPATVAQIAQTAHGGERMPPKTTFFWPKPRTGFVFRPLS